MSSLEQTTAIEIRETRISLSESGKGETILFLHGNPGSRKDFAGLLEKLADTPCRFILPDRPGHNSSEELINENNDPWLDTEVYADLIDRKCGGKTWLFGYSMGCFIAGKIAIKYPEKVKGIIMVAPYLTPDSQSEKPTSIPELAKGALLGTILGIALPLLSQTKMQTHIEKTFSPAPVPDDYLETWLPRYTRFESLMAMMIDKNAMLNILQDVHDGLKKITCPVTVMLGAKDAVCSVENQRRIISENLPAAKLQIIEEGGHALPLTHAQDCLNMVREALKIS